MTTLKEYTQASHDAIENTELSNLIFTGGITEKQWNLFVFQKLAIYREIERRVSMPETLQRIKQLELDCDGLPRSLCVNTAHYVHHLESLEEEQLAAHVYVHYLGELYGGQMLKKMIPHDNKTHMDFEDRTSDIAFVRKLVDGHHDELSDEAIKAFEFMMDIQNEIFRITVDS